MARRPVLHSAGRGDPAAGALWHPGGQRLPGMHLRGLSRQQRCRCTNHGGGSNRINSNMKTCSVLTGLMVGLSQPFSEDRSKLLAYDLLLHECFDDRIKEVLILC